MSGRRDVFETVPGLRELAAQYDGVLARADAYRLGLSVDQVGWQVAARRWRTIGTHVLVTHLGQLSRRAQWRAATLHGGRSCGLAGWTTLEQGGLHGWERERIHLLIPRGVSVPPLPAIVLHSSRRFVPERDLVIRGGLPTVRIARAAVDAAAWTDRPDDAVALLAAAVQQRLVTAAELRVELEAAGSLTHRRHLAAHLDDIAGGAQALSEIRIGRILRAAGLPPPRRQERVVLAGRPSWLDLEVDLPDGTVLTIEIDGPEHDDVRIRAGDTIRDISNVGRGTRAVRISPWALRHREAELVSAFRELHRSALHHAQLAAHTR